jgi:hypothetical protein
MDALNLSYNYGNSLLVQSPKSAAFLTCFEHGGWEVILVTPTRYIPAEDRRRHGEEFTTVPATCFWVTLPSGKRVYISLKRKRQLLV